MTDKFKEVSEQILKLAHDNKIPISLALYDTEEDDLRIHVCDEFPVEGMEKLDDAMEKVCIEQLAKDLLKGIRNAMETKLKETLN